MEQFKANLSRMKTTYGEVVQYELLTHSSPIPLNNWIGSEIKIKFDGFIYCLHCKKTIQKSYAGGYCYPCMQDLPQTDMCMMKPELCHYDRGTCRDPAWGEKNCFNPHFVYLARSSAIKVGITREIPPETRWMDQGAVEAMIIAEVPDRKTSGLIETSIAAHIHDKTDFRKMLRGDIVDDSLEDVFESIADYVPPQLQSYLLTDRKIVKINYPLNKHPVKIKTVSLDKQPDIKAKLMGIKGQYLIFEDFVFNVRTHSGYEVIIEGESSSTPSSFSTEKEEKTPSLFDFF